MFGGPLKEKSEEEQVSYLQIWSGEQGIELVQTWNLTEADSKKFAPYWERFEKYVAPKNKLSFSKV